MNSKYVIARNFWFTQITYFGQYIEAEEIKVDESGME
jgi:hypothetical protein